MENKNNQNFDLMFTNIVKLYKNDDIDAAMSLIERLAPESLALLKTQAKAQGETGLVELVSAVEKTKPSMPKNNGQNGSRGILLRFFKKETSEKERV